MTSPSHQPATSSNFSAAFERMCNFVAIAETRNGTETRCELILQCFVILENDRFNSAKQILEALETLFGIVFELSDIEDDLDNLISNGFLIRTFNSRYVLDAQKRVEMQERLNEATQLEDKVRSEWFSQIDIVYPQLDHEAMWRALRQYLALSFRRHGLQAARYLDPSHDTPDEYLNGLNSLLKKAVDQAIGIPAQRRKEASDAISNFLADVGQHPDRIKYIAQLADGTFNYFSLTVDPEVAQQFRGNLERLTLFLDTNFLFGILDLHANSFVEVSIQILEAVLEHKLPFTLRYHVETSEEFVRAIQFHGEKLRSRTWSPAISRAAARSQRMLSGIELKYHTRNAEQPLDVDSFLKPYEHFDVLLKKKGVDVYRAVSNADRAQLKADLLSSYDEFLTKRHKQKPASLVDHDVTVIDAVLELRERASSTVKAGALLLTCDYTLYRFDQEISRRTGRKGCVLLPNVFMQMLRPFIPSSTEFDRSFAETFAIPEFRIIGSGAAKATSRLMSLLASYRDVQEETAVKLLSNDLLLDRLTPIEDDIEFQQLVDAEIINDNNSLMEEKAALERQLEEEKQQRIQEQEDREREKEEQLRERQLTLETIEQEQRQKAEALGLAERVGIERENTKKSLESEQEARRIAEEEKNTAELLAAKLAKQNEFYGDAFWIGASVILALVLFLSMQLSTLDYLTQNPERPVVQILAAALLFSLILGISRRKWRGWLWGTLGLSILLTLVTVA